MVKVIKRVEAKQKFNVNCHMCKATIEYEWSDIKVIENPNISDCRHIKCPDCGSIIMMN